MLLKFENFLGTFPIIGNLNPEGLPPNMAVEAKNCYLDSGAIRPMFGVSVLYQITKAGNIRTIYFLNDKWISWVGYINAVKSPIEDHNHRCFYTGDGYPKQTDNDLAFTGAASTYPTTSRRLGVVAPPTTPTVIAGGTGNGTINRAVTYFYTYVTAFGEESIPSAAPDPLNLEEGEYAIISNISINSLAASGNDIEYVRIYRAVTGSDGTTIWQQVKVRLGLALTMMFDIPVASIPNTSTRIYDHNDTQTDVDVDWLGDECVTEGWAAPPDDLEGLIAVGNGMVAGFVDNLIYINEPFYYYAFPTDLQYATQHPIVGLGYYNRVIIAICNGNPVALIGSDPSAFEQQALPWRTNCTSARSIVSSSDGVFWSSSDGLMWTDGFSVKNLTSKIYSKDQWEDFDLDNMIGVYFGGKYIAFFEGASAGFILDFENLASGIRTFDISFDVYGFFIRETGILQLLVYSGGSYRVYTWEDDAPENILHYTYRTKTMETPPTNFSWIKVEGYFPDCAGSITAKVYGDGVLRDTCTFTANGSMRLSSGYLAELWYVVLTELGDAQVKEVCLANSSEEIRYGA